MIHYFATQPHADTVLPYLNTWPNDVRDLFNIVSYNKLSYIRSAKPGIFIFSDLERLGPLELEWVCALADRLVQTFGKSVVLNHPRGLLRRAELLHALHEAGINQYRAFDIDDPGSAIRYPAFVRMINDHNGPVTPLLEDGREHQAALAQLLASGRDRRQLLTIEFCDTRSSDGLYRKYSSFRIGDRIVPGHVLTSSDWISKDSPPEPMRPEELEYLTQNPHARELKQIFDLARIDYGRIDYGLKDGRIQVWEINTNPTLIQTRDKYAPDKLPMKQQLVNQLSDAFLALHRGVEAIPQHAWASVPLRLFYESRLKPRATLHRFFRGMKL